MIKYSKVSLENNQDNCPRKKEFISPSGEITEFTCGTRTCPSVACRERWSNKQWHLLLVAHAHLPFSNTVRITPPHHLSDTAKVTFIQKWLKYLKQWCKRNNEPFDMVLFPDRHGKSSLHWNGVVRASKRAIKRAKYLLKIRMCSYAMPVIKNFAAWSAYAVGRTHQRQMGVIKVARKQVLFRMGKPYFMQKAMLWKFILEGWRIRSYVK